MKVLLVAIGVLVLAVAFAGLLLWAAAAHDKETDG